MNCDWCDDPVPVQSEGKYVTILQNDPTKEIHRSTTLNFCSEECQIIDENVNDR